MHDYGGQVLGVLETHVLPRPAPVGALVDPVTETDMSAAHVLAGADPNDVRSTGVNGHRPDAVR